MALRRVAMLQTILWPGPAGARVTGCAGARQTKGHCSQPAQAPATYPAAPATPVAQHRYHTHLPAPCPPQVLVPLAVLAQPSATPSPSSSVMAPWMGPSMGPPALTPPGPPGQAYQCNGYNSGGGSGGNNGGNDGGGSPLQCAPAQQRMLQPTRVLPQAKLHAY